MIPKHRSLLTHNANKLKQLFMLCFLAACNRLISFDMQDYVLMGIIIRQDEQLRFN